MRVLATLLFITVTCPLFAQEAPPLPRDRPAETTAATAAPVAVDAPAAAEATKTPAEAEEVPLPRQRPDTEPDVAAPAGAPDEDAVETEGADGPVEAVEQAPAGAVEAEEVKPPRIYQTACPAVIGGQVAATALPPIEDGICRVQSPLAVTGVLANGRMIPFSSEAVLDCGMATALPLWVGDVDGYLEAVDNTGIESVIVGTSYMCRNVNNGASGNTSFHGFADALDVVGFKLEDGRTVTVEQGWTGTAEQGSRIVKFAHDAACTRFTTTLGPEANAQHHDHLHLDLGCHGARCVARLCE